MAQTSSKRWTLTVSTLRPAAQFIIVLVGYLIAGKLGQATTNIRSSNLGPVWPAYGVVLAAFLLCGYRIWPAVAAGAFVVAFLSPVSYITALGQAAGATLAGFTGAFLLRRVAKFDNSVSHLRDALALIVFGAFGSALVSSSLGVLVLLATRVRPYLGIGSAWLIYWMGDSTGVLLVTPLILTFPRLFRLRAWRRITELVILMLVLTDTCLIIFGGKLFHGSQILEQAEPALLVAFAVLLFVMWGAIRFGVAAASLSLVLISTVATIETALGSGPFARGDPFTKAVLLDVFFSVISITGLILGALYTEREQSQRERALLLRKQELMGARLRLASIVESSDDAIMGVDLNGSITDWNKGSERLYGYSGGEAIGKSLSLLLPRSQSDEVPAILREISNKQVVQSREIVCRKKDGVAVEVLLTASPILDASGNLEGASVIARDITERKRQEGILRESESRFRLLADSAPVLIWMSGTDKYSNYFNKPWLDFTGRSLEQEVGHGWAEGVHPDDRQFCVDTYTRSFDGRESFKMEYRLRRYDGEYRWILDIGVPRFNPDRSFAGYIGVCLDVTDRKVAEQELAHSNERLRLAMEAGRIGGWERDLRSGKSLWFGNAHELLGTTPDVTGGSIETFWDGVHPESRQGLRDALERARRDGTEFNEEFRVVWADGSIHWLRSQGRYFYAADGEPERLLGISLDVTSQKLAETALRKSEERFRLAAQAGKMYAYEWDVASDVIVRSGKIDDVLGLKDEPSKLTRQELLARIHPDDRAIFVSSTTERTPENPDCRVTYRFLRQDGSAVWLEKTAHASFDNHGNLERMRGLVADITERKMAEDALRDVSRKMVEVQEQERTRIARELHDDINQRLAMIAIEIEQIRQELGDSHDDVEHRLRQAWERITEVSSGVQSISHELHSPQLEYLGTVAALKSFCRDFAARRQMEIDFAHDDIQQSASYEISLCLLRILQESLQNAAKHSNVRHVEIELRCAENQLHLRVSDRGTGFDPAAVANKQGVGLISMRERVRLVNGTLTIDSKLMGGTRIDVSVPFIREEGLQRVVGQ